MPIAKTKERVDVNKRRIINGEDGDVMQLYPMKHTFAWDMYNAANANHWLPTEISMQMDIELHHVSILTIDNAPFVDINSLFCFCNWHNSLVKSYKVRKVESHGL